MRNLTISDNPINDFTPLSSLSTVQMFTADKTSLRDLSVLQNNTNMTYFSVQDTPVDSIAALGGMNNLNFVALTRANISDISPLNGKANLSILWIGDNYVNHWSAGTSKDAKDNVTPHIGYGIWQPQKRIAVSDAGGVLTNVTMTPGSNRNVSVITQSTSNGTTWGASSEIWTLPFFYESSDPAIAYIDNATMQLRAVANGTATITVKRGSTAATGFNAYSFNVTVATPTLTSITVTPNTASVLVNGTQQYIPQRQIFRTEALKM
ncbi:hypothetical protein [Paenibacillus validus]|uniref:hypothetical protein n=1 Tax=Paenibacillus validus TaxID=44253 RepID=UPI003D2C4FCF